VVNRDVRLAVQRAKPSEYDWSAVERAANFIESLCHTRGPLAGQQFKLQPWQLFIVAELFGATKDGLRQYRRSFITVPRKNGKTTLAAALALFLLLADGEAGPEVLCVATAREQALFVVQEAQRMVLRSGYLRRNVEVYRHEIVCRANDGRLVALGADKDVIWGRNPSGAVIDELHAHRNRDLWDAVNTAPGARAQPLLLVTTTAGEDRAGLYTELREYSRDVLEGRVADPAWFAFCAAIDDEDDWTSQRAWKKANPNLGTSIGLEQLRDEFRQAATPAAQLAFRRMHLNEEVTASGAWLPLEVWREQEVPRLPNLRGRSCFVGLDVSRTTDLTAAVFAFPEPDGRVWVVPFCWAPQSAIERGKRSRLYRQWLATRQLFAVPGDIVDQQVIRRFLLEARMQNGWQIERLYADPFGAAQLLHDLKADGLPAASVVEHLQYARYMEPAIQATERLAYQRKLLHVRNDVMDFCLGNVEIKADMSGQRRFDKRKSTGPIDLAVALVMACGHIEDRQANPQVAIQVI